jgi:hypothetical protein
MTDKLPAATGIVATAILVVLFAAAAGLNFKLAADGYRSHTVGTQLKLARYAWYTGDLPGAAEALMQAGSTIPEAGLRWQMAQTYFFLARSQHLQGDPVGADRFCRKALEALDYGQFDHTRNGTSTTSYKCDHLHPAG